MKTLLYVFKYKKNILHGPRGSCIFSHCLLVTLFVFMPNKRGCLCPDYAQDTYFSKQWSNLSFNNLQVLSLNQDTDVFCQFKRTFVTFVICQLCDTLITFAIIYIPPKVCDGLCLIHPESTAREICHP